MAKKPTTQDRLAAIEKKLGFDEVITRIFFLLDRSGSMNIIKSDTIGGFNTYLDTITKEIGDSGRFTMAQFDSQGFDVMSEDSPLDKAVRLDDRNYQPRGGTPLVDSAMRLIGMAEKAARPNDRVIIVLQTDGQENQSKEHTNNDLKAKIESLQGKDWAVNFIGAGIDAYAEASKYGINVASTMSYGLRDSRSAFAATARASTSYSLTGASMDSHFTEDEKDKAGDVHRKKGSTESGNTTSKV